jgi:hypothetical protein
MMKDKGNTDSTSTPSDGAADTATPEAGATDAEFTEKPAE